MSRNTLILHMNVYKAHLHFTSWHRHTSIFWFHVLIPSSPMSHSIKESFWFTGRLVWYYFISHSMQIIWTVSRCILITPHFLFTVSHANLCQNHIKSCFMNFKIIFHVTVVHYSRCSSRQATAMVEGVGSAQDSGNCHDGRCRVCSRHHWPPWCKVKGL
jgi:hypothetical protein